jgi:hypothetical protein
MKTIYTYIFVITMTFSINVVSDERASYGNCYLALGYIQGKLQNKIDNFVDGTGLDPTKMEVFERKDKKLYFTLGIIDEDLYKSIKREGLTTENMWCTSGKGYETRYNLDNNSNLIVNNPQKFTINSKDDFLNAVSNSYSSSDSKNIASSPNNDATKTTTNPKISKSILDKINKVAYKSSLPYCMDSNPIMYSNWDASKLSQEECQIVIIYEKDDEYTREFFVGEYNNGKRSYGTMSWQNGYQWYGEWRGSRYKGKSLYADGTKIESLWYENTQLAEKCESFGIKLNSSYNKQCQEIMLNEYSKN